MKRLALLLVYVLATPVYGFMPEREEYNPLRSKTCDLLASPSITSESGCFALGGQINVWSYDFGYGGEARAEGLILATSSADISGTLVETHFSIASGEYGTHPSVRIPTIDGAYVSVGGEDWIVRAGKQPSLSVDEIQSVLNFYDAQPFGDFYVLMPASDRGGTAILASFSPAPGWEFSAEASRLESTGAAGMSASYSNGTISAHATIWGDEIISGVASFGGHAGVSISEKTWRVVGAVGITDNWWGDEWSGLISGEVDFGRISIAGVYGYSGSMWESNVGLALTYRLTDDFRVLTSIERRYMNEMVYGYTEYRVSGYYDLTENIELYATVRRANHSLNFDWTQFESGIRYEPSEALSVTAQLRSAWPGQWGGGVSLNVSY